MSESVEAPSSAAGEPGLKRAIGPKVLLFFVVGDIVGVGIYSLTGKVAGAVGGAAWMAFGAAFLVALCTAASYAELVGKFPKAAGAALYTHRAFNLKFLTFLVAFTVMCSGLTSASTGSITIGNTSGGTDLQHGGSYLGQFLPEMPTILLALVFLLIISVVNFWGVTESVRLNVILTSLSILGLLFVIIVGFLGLIQGKGDMSVPFTFNPEGGIPLSLIISGAALSFFALVGFEDSVNMVEETKNPQRTFPRALFLGLSICGVLYMAVAFAATALVDIDALSSEKNTAPLLNILREAAPWFPLGLFAIVALCSIANTALINMMMASRLVYGMAEERIIPRILGRVHPLRRTPWVSILFTVAIAVALISYGTLKSTDAIKTLGNTTSLLLLAVFAIVNVVVLVLRRRSVDHEHFKAWTWVPIVGVVCSLVLITPVFSGRTPEEYAIAGVLLAVGILLWLVNWLGHGRKTTDFDVEKLSKD